MKVTLVGLGTRGDIQPQVCLGWELQSRGHEVTLVAPTNMRAFIEKAGLRYASIGIDAEATFNAPDALEMLASGKILRFLNWLGKKEAAERDILHEGLVEGTRGADVIVSHFLTEDALCAIAAARKVPLIPLHYYPVLPGPGHPHPFFFSRSSGPLNSLLHRVAHYLLWRMSRPGAVAMRKRFELGPPRESLSAQITRRNLPVLMSFSPEIVQRPEGYSSSIHTCAGTRPSPELKRVLDESGLPAGLSEWLEQGPPPFYIGLGSMPVVEPAATLNMVREALQELNARAVVVAGWSRFVDHEDERLKVVANVDHAALLARCCGAVHHGGAGTTYAAMRAGIPSYVTSVFFDQPFWGARVADLGVGCTTAFKRLNASTLLRGLREIQKPAILERARVLGDRMRHEDGASELADVLESIAPTAPLPH